MQLQNLKKYIDYSGKYPVLKYDGDLHADSLSYENEKKRIYDLGFKSLSDYILVNLFNYQLQEDKSVKKVNKMPKIRFVENKFPYSIKNKYGVCEHYILWIEDKQNVEEALRQCFKFFTDIYFKNEFVYFQNESKNKSVNLTHFHFIGN